MKTVRKKDPEPTIADMVAFEDPKGTVMEVFKRPEPPQGFRSQGSSRTSSAMSPSTSPT